MSAPESDDPGREFVAYLHAAATQVTASAMRTRADRERRDRDRRQSFRNWASDQSRARRDARYDADAARRASEHEARMKLHRARLEESLARLESVQQARTFAAGVGQTREFQHNFDQLIGAFAAATATRDMGPQHAELAELLAQQLREQTGLDPGRVIAEAQQRVAQRPDWIDSGHEVTAELADVLVEMRLDQVGSVAPPTERTEGTAIGEHIARARVGQPPLGPDAGPGTGTHGPAEEPVLAAQRQAASDIGTGQEAGL